MDSSSATRDFELQGHRGARGLFPENTIEGFAATLAVGVSSIELDVAITADGVAVVSHDPTLDPDITRGPDGAWIPAPGPAIRTLTLAQLGAYDIGRMRPGSFLARIHVAQAPSDGARIPTLAEVFRRTAPAGVTIDAELKTLPGRPDLTVTPAEMADAVVACAERAGALDRLVVRSFDWRGLRHLRQVRPAVRLAWLTGEDKDPRTLATRVAAEAGRAPWTATWAPLHGTLTQAVIASAHELGLRVVPWTVNGPEDMRWLIAWGVDGLCTDRPDLARTAMRQAGLRLPAPYIAAGVDAGPAKA